MLLRNTFLLMLALSLSMAALSAHASPGRTGIIRTVNLAEQYIVIDAQRYPISKHTKITNLTGTNNGLQAGYPAHFFVNHGELKRITVYPKNAAERQKLGYRDQHDFPQ